MNFAIDVKIDCRDPAPPRHFPGNPIRRYGRQLRSDSEGNKHVFSSLHSLSDAIAVQGTR